MVLVLVLVLKDLFTDLSSYPNISHHSLDDFVEEGRGEQIPSIAARHGLQRVLRLHSAQYHTHFLPCHGVLLLLHLHVSE